MCVFLCGVGVYALFVRVCGRERESARARERERACACKRRERGIKADRGTATHCNTMLHAAAHSNTL